ncbi:MAG TPA: DUF6438 domain-containing protein [Anaerolineales bacterium]|nr:DUF6438 domain-containing protein [Anaerolineales bacterium]
MTARSNASVRSIAFFAVFLSACGLQPLSPTPTVPASVPADFQVTIERGPCFGACPVYNLTVGADGSVEYEGIRFVGVEGVRTTRLSEDEVKALVAAVVTADFFRLADRYEVQVTDLPSIDTTVTMDGRTKGVYHYGLGCGTEYDQAPQALCDLEALLEGIPLANGWVSAP